MAKGQTPSEDTPDVEDIQVRLKPFLGIAPTTYVPVIWGVLILAGLFLILVYPAVRFYGSRVTVTSVPSGAEVYVDDLRVGATPVTAFVDAGERQISVDLPGHDPIERTIVVNGRWIGSLVFPRRERMSLRFDSFDRHVLLVSAVREFAAWSTTGGASAQFQYPPSANDASRSLVASMVGARDSGRDDQAGGYLSDYLTHFAPHVSETQTADLLAGANRIAAAGALFGPDAIAQLVHTIAQLESQSPAAYRVLPTFDGAIAGHPWYGNRENEYSTRLLTASVVLDEGSRGAPELVQRGPLQFARVPAGTYVVGYPARDEQYSGRTVEFDRDFWIQDEAVSIELFDSFIASNPRWAADNRSALIDSGPATRDYPVDRSDVDGGARTFVSYFAAEAFVDWLNRESPYPPLPGYRYVLPTAEEWEYAAFLNDGAWSVDDETPVRRGALGIPIMSGGVWEWTATWHGIHGRYIPVPEGDQRIVMGGSAINDDAGHSLRGAQPPDWATPFLGFRVAMEAIPNQ